MLKIGDHVMVNHHGNNNYSITKAGSIGVVADVWDEFDDYDIFVRFSYISTDRGTGSYYIKPHCLTKIIPNNPFNKIVGGV